MPNIDPITFGPTTRVSWSQVTDKPAWFSNVSGGGTAPLNIDMQNGSAYGFSAPNQGSAAVSADYIKDTILAPYKKDVDIIQLVDAAKAEVKAYTDTKTAAIDLTTEWADVANKPEWTGQLQYYSGDSTGVRIISNLDMNQGRIENLGLPMTDDEGTNKKYVDDKIKESTTLSDSKASDNLSAAKLYTDQAISTIEDPYWADIQNKPEWSSYIDYDTSGSSLFVIKPLDLRTNKLSGVGAPTLLTDAATKKYVDDALGFKVDATEFDSTVATLAPAASVTTAASTTLASAKAYTDTKVADIDFASTWANVTGKPQWVSSLEYAPSTASDPNTYVKVITNLDMNNHVIGNVGAGTLPDQAVNLSQLQGAAKQDYVDDYFEWFNSILPRFERNKFAIEQTITDTSVNIKVCVHLAHQVYGAIDDGKMTITGITVQPDLAFYDKTTGVQNLQDAFGVEHALTYDETTKNYYSEIAFGFPTWNQYADKVKYFLYYIKINSTYKLPKSNIYANFSNRVVYPVSFASGISFNGGEVMPLPA